MTDDAKLSISKRLSLALLSAALGTFLCLLPWGEAWDRFAYDSFFRLRGGVLPPEDVVVVAIDETSFAELDRAWPWPRSIHAKLIDALFKAGVKTIAFDVLFAEPTSPKEDQALADAITRHKNVVLGEDVSLTVDPHLGFEQVQVVQPDPILERAKVAPVLGVVDLKLDQDGFLRTSLRKFAEGEAFSFAAYKNFVRGDTAQKKYPKQWRINFYGPERTIRTVSYYQALDPARYLPKDFFKDKLVFVGFSVASQANTETEKADHFPIPFTRFTGGYMPGVEIHAQAAAGLLEDKLIRVFPTDRLAIVSAVLAFGFGFLFLSLSPLYSTAIAIAALLGIVASSYWLFLQQLLYISPALLGFPLAISYLFSPFMHYLQTQRQKAFIRRAFQTYLAPGVVERVLKNPRQLELGGEELEGTVMFIDLQGFTSFSENLSPQELITVVNRNLGVLSEIILKNQGMIDKYIGDATMAVWGVPIVQKDHARNACQAATEILALLPQLAAAEKAKTGIEISLRIGLCSGQLVAGNVGGGGHFNYTVLGNTVNLASRLEGLNKIYGTRAVLSEATAAAAKDHFKLRELDSVRVKGKKQPEAVYELVNVSRTNDQVLKTYAEGLRLYRTADFSHAAVTFQRALSLNAEDGPAHVFYERACRFAEHPPVGKWDGVFEMETK